MGPARLLDSALAKKSGPRRLIQPWRHVWKRGHCSLARSLSLSLVARSPALEPAWKPSSMVEPLLPRARQCLGSFAYRHVSSFAFLSLSHGTIHPLTALSHQSVRCAGSSNASGIARPRNGHVTRSPQRTTISCVRGARTTLGISRRLCAIRPSRTREQRLAHLSPSLLRFFPTCLSTCLPIYRPISRPPSNTCANRDGASAYKATTTDADADARSKLSHRVSRARRWRTLFAACSTGQRKATLQVLHYVCAVCVYTCKQSHTERERERERERESTSRSKP